MATLVGLVSQCRAGNHCRVLLALLLATVLCWVGSSRTGVGLGEGTDHGMAGAAAERSGADTLPTGKPVNEANSENFEREAEEAVDIDVLASRAPNEVASLVGQSRLETATAFVRRDAPTLASNGARGPPVG